MLSNVEIYLRNLACRPTGCLEKLSSSHVLNLPWHLSIQTKLTLAWLTKCSNYTKYLEYCNSRKWQFALILHWLRASCLVRPKFLVNHKLNQSRKRN